MLHRFIGTYSYFMLQLYIIFNSNFENPNHPVQPSMYCKKLPSWRTPRKILSSWRTCQICKSFMPNKKKITERMAITTKQKRHKYLFSETFVGKKTQQNFINKESNQVQCKTTRLRQTSSSPPDGLLFLSLANLLEL